MISLKLIPSIDIFDGKVVRFMKGDPETSVIYNEDPVNIAKKWVDQGADAIHVVDLDAAIGTKRNNLSIIEKIVGTIEIPIQVGGGIRDFDYASSLFAKGVASIVVGTLAFKYPLTIKRLIKTFGSEKIIVALDYLDETVVVKGWTTSTGILLEDAFIKFQNIGVNLFLMTSVERDGTLKGPDYKTLRKINEKFKIKLIASGGIRSVHDILHLGEIGVFGAIIGKALYEEKFNLKTAVSALRRR